MCVCFAPLCLFVTCSRYVSVLSLYGTCDDLFARAAMTLPRADSDWLMACASFIASPVTPERPTRSEPALTEGGKRHTGAGGQG